MDWLSATTCLGKDLSRSVLAYVTVAYRFRLVWLLTGLFFIVSYPSSLFLDWLLGKESGTLYKRTELSALVDMHGPVISAAEGGVMGVRTTSGIDRSLQWFHWDLFSAVDEGR